MMTGVVATIAALVVRWSDVDAVLIAYAALLSAVVLVVGEGIRAVRDPLTDDVVARSIDKAMGVDAVVGASLESIARGTPTRVERALVASAEGVLKRWSPEHFVAMPRRRTAAIAVAPWLALAVATAWPGHSAIVATTPTSVDTIAWTMVAEVDEAAARKIERISHLLGSEAFVRDAAVQEVASAFAELRERVARGDLPSADVWSEIATLGAQAAAALGYADDPTFRAGDGAGAAEVGAGARPATDRERATPMLDEGRREEAIEAMDPPSDGERILDSLLERLEVDAVARATPDEDADLSDVSFRPAVDPALDGLYFDNPETQAAAEAALESAREAGVARPDLGGAVAGDAGGLGGVDAGGLTQGLDQGTAVGRTLSEDELEYEAVALPSNEPAGTRRLQVLAAPPAADAGTAERDADVEPGAWRASAEAFFGARNLPPTTPMAFGFHRRGEGAMHASD